MRLSRFLVLTAAAMVTAPHGVAASVQQDVSIEPFRVIGNIYYVGGQLGSYLITTPDGHILHDTGTARMHALIVSNIEKLGFDPRDVRIMISSHAHFDHVEGHAQMQRRTGAQVVALGGDAVALESGHDNSALGARGWEPVTVDRVIGDGDTVTLGGVTLRALWTGGHTQGATMWFTTVQEEGTSYSVAFRGGEIPNRRVQLFDNPRHPTVVDDTKRTLEMLDALEPPDIVLLNHAQAPPPDLDPALRVDSRCVTCLDAEGWRSRVERAKATFEEMLREAEGQPARQRLTRQRPRRRESVPCDG
ncbi:MAG: MBL fold metallo-hydrolase [Myxococcales bacterium]|nr:MBL fold metallo-hydrolase [Myxococcales bacterium]